MPAAYSTDVREIAMKNYESGLGSQQEIADHLGIHLSTFKRIYKFYKEKGTVVLPKRGGGRPSLLDESGYEVLKQFVTSNPSITLEEIQKKYKKETGILLSLSTVCRGLKQLNLNRKKISHYAQEQEREDVKKKENHTAK